jgi:hypothetical protein
MIKLCGICQFSGVKVSSLFGGDILSKASAISGVSGAKSIETSTFEDGLLVS